MILTYLYSFTAVVVRVKYDEHGHFIVGKELAMFRQLLAYMIADGSASLHLHFVGTFSRSKVYLTVSTVHEVADSIQL